MKKILEFIKEEYKFIIFLILLYIILQYPLNYYIVTGGGTSDVSTRIEVANKYKEKGSFNISYVTELQGTILTYGLSYIIPTWEREDANLYKYNEKESIEDIEFRSNLDLLTSNGTATYWAYKLANKEIKEKLSINGNTYNTVDEYREYIQTLKENDEAIIKIKRKNKEKEIKTKIYKYKDRLILGVGLQFVREYNTNPEAKIKFRSSESGPSGGLITTLELYNQLTKKDITKGLKITGTGTIEEDGTIGEIGGVEHKLLGAYDAKSDIFLVPDGQNYKDAIKYKKDKKLKIKIIKVRTIEEALEELNKL